MSDGRRAFFKKAAGAAVGLAGADTLLGGAARAASEGVGVGAAAARPVGAARFALRLEEKVAGFLKTTEGGEVSAEVVDETVGSPKEPCAGKKHLGPLNYEPITIQCGTGMGADFYDWIESFVTCELKTRSRSGALLAADFAGKEIWRREFADALITEFGLPTLDQGSKEAAHMTLKFAPASTSRQEGGGKVIGGCGTKVGSKWLSSNFKLAIEGLDCTKVSKVEALVVKQQMVDEVGEVRFKLPGKMEFPNLVVSLAESAAKTFYQWHEDFLINGNSGPENEKQGTLEYLSANLKDVLFQVKFEGLGIFKLAMDKADSSDAIKKVTAHMYCDRMTFLVMKGAEGC